MKTSDPALVFTIAGGVLAAIGVCAAIARQPATGIGCLAAGFVVGWALCRFAGPVLDRWRA